MIIESLLDTDLYKFTMQQCVLHQFPGADAEYRFKCRTPGIDLSPFVDEINAELDHLCSLYFREDELAYLDSLRFIKSDYVEFLSLFHLKRKYISVTKSQDYPCGIDITAKGPWLHTILFEIPVLAIVNEVYFRNTYPDLDETEGVARLERKIELLRNEPDNGGLRISDYGTRRRFSKAWQKKVLLNMKERLGGIFTGTSNVMYAKEQGYVETLFHRRRELPEIRSSNFNMRSFGERVALNMPIQGTAADIMKLAMVAVEKRLKRELPEAKLVLQVHDELIVECPEPQAEAAAKLLEEEMEQVAHLSVPLTAEAHWGRNWLEAKG